MTFIHTPEQKDWLVTTHLHGISVSSFACATLVGPEDKPICIVLYTTRDFKSLPRVFVCDAKGCYVEEEYRR